jgi:hypothetical protein
MPLMTPTTTSVTAQAVELVYLTSRDEDVLHDGDKDEKSQSMAPSLAYARREGKERRNHLFSGVKFLSTFRVLRAN